MESYGIIRNTSPARVSKPGRKIRQRSYLEAPGACQASYLKLSLDWQVAYSYAACQFSFL